MVRRWSKQRVARGMDAKHLVSGVVHGSVGSALGSVPLYGVHQMRWEISTSIEACREHRYHYPGAWGRMSECGRGYKEHCVASEITHCGVRCTLEDAGTPVDS